MWWQILAQVGMGGTKGAIAQGSFKNKARIAEYNAAVKREEAKSIRYMTKFLQRRQAEAGERTQDELITGIGGSQTVSSMGANRLAIALQKSESDLEGYMFGKAGQAKADQAENEALQYDMQRRMAREEGRNALTGGFLSGAGGGMQTFALMPKKTNTA